MGLSALNEILTIKGAEAHRLSYAHALRQPQRTLASFVLTKEAQGSLARLLLALKCGRPEAFGLTGPRGAGKTHFLACLTSLFANRPTVVPEGFKHNLQIFPALCIAVEVADGAHLAQAISEALWEKLKIRRHLLTLWRRLGVEAGLRATLERVGHDGFSRTMIMIDDAGDHGPDIERWRMLNDLATSSGAFGSPAFFIVAARGEPPAEVAKLPVAAKTAREVVAMTLGAIRSFAPNSEAPLKRYYHLYAAANHKVPEFDEFNMIFPFHERTIEVLGALARGSLREGVMAEIVKETLSANGSEPLLEARRLVMPADLLRSSAARLRIRAASLDQSLESYELALMRLSQMELSPSEASLASDLVKTLFLTSFLSETRRRWLTPSELVQLVAFNLPTIDAAAVSKLLESMATALDGMIVLESDGRARYQPAERPDSFLRRWNAGLALLRLVEPELTEARNVASLFTQAEKFCAALRDRRAHLSNLCIQLRILAAVLGASPPALSMLSSFGELLATDNHEAYLKQAAMLTGGVEALPAMAATVARFQRLAERAPQLVEIKRYVDAIPSDCAALEPIQLMRLELRMKLDFQSLLARPQLTDSLVERFREFKARYCDLYLAAHRQRRAEIELFGQKLELLHLRLAVLTSLDRVRELGDRIGAELESELKKLTLKLTPCPESLATELAASPRCPVCEFGFEDGPPLAQLEELERRLMAALDLKLKALSRPSVIHILTQFDSQERLSEFLQLLRQGAKEELIAALDEDTAGYIVSRLNKARSEALTSIVDRTFGDAVGASADNLENAVKPGARLRKVS